MIPATIHHVWPGEDHFRFEHFRKTWVDHNRDWTFKFWRHIDNHGKWIDTPCLLRKIMEDNRFTVVVKSDLLRYWILYKFGGVYVDTDFECLKSFDEFRKHTFFCGKENDTLISPSLIGATPEHPLSKALMIESLNTVDAQGPEACNKSPHLHTGPHLITRLIKQYSDVVIYEAEYFYPVSGPDMKNGYDRPTPNAYAKHHFNGAKTDGWQNVHRFGSA